MEKKTKQIQDNMKILFEQLFRKERSESFRDIFREVYGDEYPEEANPDGFSTLTDLRYIVRHLKIDQGSKIIDLGCARGGPGLLIARKTGASYVGVDLSENAIQQAKKKIKGFSIQGKAKFHVGDIATLEFPDNSFDGAFSIDVLSFLPNLPKALFEIARILRKGAYFIFTTWEDRKQKKFNFQKALKEVGFKVMSCEEVEGWEQKQREVYEKTLERKKTLINDMGRDGAFGWILDAKTYMPTIHTMRRIICIAENKR